VERHNCKEESSATEKNRNHNDAETQRMDQYYEESEEQQGLHGYQNYGLESINGWVLAVTRVQGLESPI